jgi:hypothetical protein
MKCSFGRENILHAQSIRPLGRLKFLVQIWIGKFRRVGELEEGIAHRSLV